MLAVVKLEEPPNPTDVGVRSAGVFCLFVIAEVAEVCKLIEFIVFRRGGEHEGLPALGAGGLLAELAAIFQF